MGNRLYDEDDIRNIAEAIRAKNGKSTRYSVAEMANAIRLLNGTSTQSNFWNINVIDDGSEPSDDIPNTITLVYTKG